MASFVFLHSRSDGARFLRNICPHGRKLSAAVYDQVLKRVENPDGLNSLTSRPKFPSPIVAGPGQLRNQ